MNKKLCAIRIFFFLIVAIICQPVLYATVKLQSASLQQGSTMARYMDATAWLQWKIVNPDSEEATVVLQLEPDSSFDGAIYSTRITIGAKAQLEGRSQVSIGSAERYIVSLIQKNTRVDKTEILTRPAQANRLNVAVLTDDDEFPGTSDVAKSEMLYRKLNFSNIRYKDIPGQASGFSIYDLLIMHKPSLSKYSVFQQKAILDYVRKGGCLVISSAETAFSVQNSILAELLPWHPLDTLEYEGLNGLRKSFALPPVTVAMRDENGDLLLPFRQTVLEVLTPTQSTIIARQGGRPLICIGQAGLGNVIGVAFDPFQACKADTELILPIWNILIRHSNHLPIGMRADETACINNILQQLQGYVIPQVREVANVFLLYIVCAILILGIAFHYKRAATGWLILCLFGAFYTLFIFRKAGRIAINQPEQSFSAVTTSIWDGNGSSQEGTGNLFSKSDCRPTITADASRFFFSPQKRSTTYAGGTALAPTPLHIIADWQNTKLEKISLQQYRPRTLCWESASGKHGFDNAELPQLTLGQISPHLAAWKIPEQLQGVRRAVLVLPGEIIPLQLLDGEISSTSRRFEGMEADLVMLDTMAYIRALRLPNPAVCLITSKITEKCELIDIDNGDLPFSGYDHHLQFIPVKLSIPEKEFVISPGFVNLDIPPKSLLRQYFRQGEFVDISIQGGVVQAMSLDFNVHHLFYGVQPSEIHISLDISNPSGKASFELTLVDLQNRSLEPIRREGNTFIFKPEKTVLKPFENRISAMLKYNYRADSGDGVSQRVSTWKIISCNMQIFCTGQTL